MSIILLGGCLVAATILWEWGHLAYGLGVVAVAVGGATLVVSLVPGRVSKAVVSVIVVAVVTSGGLLAVTGLPGSPSRWEDVEAEGPGGSSASAEGLFIAGGTPRDIASGDLVWQYEDQEAEPSLVSSHLVVLSTDDASIGLDPQTGEEIWRSTVSGRGITHDGEVLVVAHTGPDDETEAVALDLATGKTLWQRAGRPIMECDLGPVDRFSPAPERSHVLLVPDAEHESRAELLDLTDGGTTIADVDCSIGARVVDHVLLEAKGQDLTGRALTSGEQLWSTPVARPWSVEGGGPVVYTPTAASDQTSTDLTAVDTITGRTYPFTPPSGVPGYLSVLDVRRGSDVWMLLDLDTGVALWNPGTGDTTTVPRAVNLEIASADAFSGWIALSGEVRDLTGEPSSQCWALSPTGELYGPFPGQGCVAAEGLMGTTTGIYPLQ